MQHGAEDQHIISQVLAGHTAAFAGLVSRYQQYVFTLVSRYIPSREEAEEVAQDVFIKAYKSLGSFRSEAKFSTWLYSIVHTTCLSRLRLKQHGLIATDEETLAGMADRLTPSSSQQLPQYRSRSALLEEAIRLLKPEDAQIITLFYQGEQSLEEIAGILLMPANTVKVKLHRARQKLRDILIKRFPEEIQDLHYVKNNLN